MKIYQWDKFKKKYEIFAYSLVYFGYFLHVIILLNEHVNVFYLIIGYVFFFLMMARAIFNAPVILLHSVIFLIYLDSFYTTMEGKIFSIIFFIPFYSIILYAFLSVFGLESKIESKIKNHENKKVEVERMRKKKEWDNLSQEEKNKILTEKDRKEKEYLKSLNAEKIRKEKEFKKIADKQAEEINKQIELNKKIFEEEKLKQLEIQKEKDKQKAKREEEDRIKEELRFQRLREEEKRKEIEHKEYIKRKILENEKKKQLEKEAIQELIDAGLIDNNHYSGKNIRESIPTHVKIEVWNRDKERCVKCSSNTNLEFDHVIPVSKGGANTTKNLQLLCMNCNRKKSNKIM